VRIRQPDPTHTTTGGISGAHKGWGFRDDFGNAGRAVGDILGQPTEVINGILELGVEIDTVRGRSEALLQPRETTKTARDGNDHATKLTHQLMEVLLGAGFAGAWEGRQHVVKTLDAVRRKFNCTCDSIDQPAQDDLGGLERAVTFEQLLQRDRILLPAVIG
jgi:hypothetical protein